MSARINTVSLSSYPTRAFDDGLVFVRWILGIVPSLFVALTNGTFDPSRNFLIWLNVLFVLLSSYCMVCVATRFQADLHP